VTTSPLVSIYAVDVVGDGLVPTTGFLNVINGSQIDEIVVCEPLDDIPHLFPVVVAALVGL